MVPICGANIRCQYMVPAYGLLSGANRLLLINGWCRLVAYYWMELACGLFLDGVGLWLFMSDNGLWLFMSDNSLLPLLVAFAVAILM